MLLSAIVRELNLTGFTPIMEDVEVQSGYASDLLSDVMGNAPSGSVWVTMQCHPNVVAVASLLNLAAVVLVGGATPDEQTLKRATETKVTLLHSDYTAFETVGRLYILGVRGLPKHD
jgi:hypothetical protein